MAKWLTKSDYLKFLIHPAYLWLAKYAKHTLPEFDEIAQANVDQGYAVEEIAQKLWPQGVLIDAPIFEGPDATAGQMRAGGPEVLFQPSALTSELLYARSDVMAKNGDSWDIYEVKSSASIKTAHLLDLAFQCHVWREAGYKIGRCFLIHINNQYVRDGEIDPSSILTSTDVTQETLALGESTAVKIEQALEVLKLKQSPSDEPHLGGDWYGWRDIYRHLHTDIESDSVLNLTRLSLSQIKDFADIGVTKIGSIPDDFDLKPQQRAQVEVTRQGTPIIDREKITQWIDQLKYPLYFLDYETFASALPAWDGVRPFQQLPFQYSLHILADPKAALTHKEFLAEGENYPVGELLKHLQQYLGPKGSVLVWNKQFEMGCNDAMANLHPEFTEFLAGLNTRVVDLMEIFDSGWYAHPAFMGSASIKKVLQALVPELSYANLGISEGMSAQIRWMRAARGELTSAQAHQVYEHLRAYCGQDTLAMVKIFEICALQIM